MGRGGSPGHCGGKGKMSGTYGYFGRSLRNHSSCLGSFSHELAENRPQMRVKIILGFL
jgi:hypothetical protein